MPLIYNSVVTKKDYLHCNRVKGPTDINHSNPDLCVVVGFPKNGRCPEIWVVDAVSEGIESINQCYRDLGVPENMIDIVLC